MFTAVIMTINKQLRQTAGSASVFLTATQFVTGQRKCAPFKASAPFPWPGRAQQVMRNTSKQYGVSRQAAIKQCQLQKEPRYSYNPVNIHHIKHCRQKRLTPHSCWFASHIYAVIFSVYLFCTFIFHVHFVDFCREEYFFPSDICL